MSTSNAAAQTANRPAPKVLRIGLVQGGKIVQEKLIRLGETVTVGDSPKNTFVLTGTKLPTRHEMFVARGESYTLAVPEWIEGKISWKDGIRDLEELRTRGDAQRKGDAYHVPLNENVRGKVTIGESTLLFQFVPAPPEPVRQVSPADFRPRIIDEDDPLFMGLISVFGLIAFGFMTWVQFAEMPQELDLDHIDDAINLVVEAPIPQVELKDPNADKGDKEEKKPEKKPEKDNKTETKPQDTTSAPPKPVAQRSLLLQQLGTMGSTDSPNSVNNLLGDDAASMAGLDAALQGVTGAQSATASNLALHQGQKGANGDATIGGVEGGSGGTASTGSGVVTKIKRPKVDMSGDGDVDASEGDATGIPSVVRKSQGRIQTCVEQSLKSNPNLDGRVSVGWTIAGGRVTEAHLVKNTSGDDAVGKCIVNAVRTLRFDPGLTADVAEFSWVVKGE
jgi:hypothetical protein